MLIRNAYANIIRHILTGNTMLSTQKFEKRTFEYSTRVRLIIASDDRNHEADVPCACWLYALPS
jgi:hypothetical protein